MTIHHNISLKNFNTFGIEVYAKNFVEVNSIDDLKSVLKEYESTPKLILGGGSNVLFTRDFDGLVIKINIKGKEIVSKNQDHILVKAYAGEVWHELVLWSIDNNWGGLENLSLIPGSVGAAPMQNIGAYGVEIKDYFEYLEALNLKTFEIELFNNEHCKFGYRESVFKNIYKDQYIILSVVFKLSTHPVFNTSYGAIEDQLKLMHVETKTLQSISDAVIAIRQSKLPNPAELGNSGSFFKNPVVTKTFFEQFIQIYPTAPYYAFGNDFKIPAGWLIEQCGWKGKVVGNTGSHAKQALVLVNYGNATGVEVYLLAKEIQKSVFEKFKIEIEMEVNII